MPLSDIPTDALVAELSRRATGIAQTIAKVYDKTAANNAVNAVSSAFGVAKAEILAPGRWATGTLCRQVAMAILRDRGLTLTEIGAAFGRDHGTVLHACERVRGRIAKDKAFARKVKQALSTFATAVHS